MAHSEVCCEGNSNTSLSLIRGPKPHPKSRNPKITAFIGAKKSTQTFFVQSSSATLRVMDVRAENRGRPDQKVRFPATPVVGRNFLTPGRSGVRVRNVRGKSGPKSLCLCCFFFPEFTRTFSKSSRDLFRSVTASAPWLLTLLRQQPPWLRAKLVLSCCSLFAGWRKRGVGFKGGSLHDGFGGFDSFGGSGEHLALLLLVLQNTAQWVGACAMTTKFFDNKICTFKILLSWRFPRKQAFLDDFPSAPKAPPSNAKILFLLSSRRLWMRQPWRFWRFWRFRSWRLPPLNPTPLFRHPDFLPRKEDIFGNFGWISRWFLLGEAKPGGL